MCKVASKKLYRYIYLYELNLDCVRAFGALDAINQRGDATKTGSADEQALMLKRVRALNKRSETRQLVVNAINPNPTRMTAGEQG